MLDGISRIPDLVAQTKSLGMEALAITDHGTFYGVVDFYSACKEAGIKPIIGCEVYVAHGSHLDKTTSERSPNHLVLLARNNQGYRNLMQLLTLAHVEGFHYKPRVDKDLLEKYCDGLVVLSGCPSAEVPRLIADGNMEEAANSANWYKNLFGDGYFLELQSHAHVENLDQINQGLISLSRDLDIPLVVTNDSHYVHQADSPLQDVYICIQTNTTVEDEKRLRMEDDSYYIKSPEEMAQLFPDHPEAVENTQVIAAMCNVELDFGETHLPKFDTPGGIDAHEYLSSLCWHGFRDLYPDGTPEAEDRLRYELEVIQHTRFADYFLVVWDIIDFVRKNNIMFGVRGSAAGSVALYCLGITLVDPLEYRLVFERFLNMERKELPDIDLDFQDDRRDEVLHYVIDRYGQDRVAQIITFGTLGARAALRDVGRALGMTYGDVDRVARMVPLKARLLEDALRVNPEFESAYQQEENVRKLVDTARGLEGIVHHVSTHAAGVLISDEPLTGTVPLQRPTRGDESSPVLMTQLSMDPVARLGLLKMDFLGLTNLTILDRAIKLLGESQGIHIDLNKLPLDDPETFEVLSSGNTSDLFQLESSGMQRYIKDLKPSNLGDISAMIALYRPGPMEHIDRFINAKFGREKITYPHESLKDLLDETYGIIVYQDQVLLILQRFAGYSLGEADIVRKAMGKKIASLMAQEREKFVAGAQAKGFTHELAVEVFDLIEPFAGYAFNKAHSVSYALISYWTSYFKTHYPVEYMASVLNARMDNPEKVVGSINECFRLGIPVLLPDINKSEEMFIISREEDEPVGLRMGLKAIKTVGEGAVAPVVAERKENGPFDSVDDFCRRANAKGLNRRTMESLVKAGAFDALAARGPMLNALDQVIATAQLEAKARDSGQTSMFNNQVEAGSAFDQAGISGIALDGPDATDQEKASWERELLGLSLSHNPLKALAAIDAGDAFTSMDQLDDKRDGDEVTVIGHLSAIVARETKEARRYLIATLDLLAGAMEVMVWPDTLGRTQDQWKEGEFLKVTGKLRARGDQLSLACDQVEIYASNGAAQPSPMPLTGQAATHSANGQPPAANVAIPQQASPIETRGQAENGAQDWGQTSSGTVGGRIVTLGVTETGDSQGDAHLLREVVGVLLEYPGSDRINLKIHTGGHRVVMELPMVNTAYCPQLQERLESLLGADTVYISGEAGVKV
ncbi:MAG: DNA polymerase III subunit alpha [SAR202 cluster bacterium Io17-Chloro-G2]|nr:MAG: DNA polymerase III subunit alpha [SAR202 cluster bacterium Io17-Chloro-G2]